MNDEQSPRPPEQAFEELTSLDRSKGPDGTPQPGAKCLDVAAENNDNLLARELSDLDAKAALQAEQPDVGTTDVPPIPMDRTERLAQARMTGEGAPPPEA